MGAAERLARGHQVSFCELLIDLHGGVGKRLQKPAIERLEAGGRPICGGSDCASFRCIVIDELRVEDFVGEVQIVLGLADVDETPHELSVVLRRHCRSLPHVTRYGRIGLPVNC